MEIKKILENISNFLVKRFIEVFGLIISILSLLLLISLLSYSPEDPNFIFPNDTKINNTLGFRGSFVSDLFFQSIGLISILTSITLFINLCFLSIECKDSRCLNIIEANLLSIELVFNLGFLNFAQNTRYLETVG